MPAYALRNEEWGECRVCGLSFGRSELRLSRRFGWVCTAPNQWGTDCWPGLRQRDEIEVRTRAFEGTRRSTAPTVDETEGRGQLLSNQTVFYFLDQANGTTAYKMTFGGAFIPFPDSVGDWRAADIDKPVGGWVLADGANRIWVRNGSLEFGTRLRNLPYAMVEKPNHVGLAVVGGFLEYTA